MKMNSLPDETGAQTNGVKAPGVLLARSILSSNSVPEPFSGTKVLEKADIRRVLIVLEVARMFAETFQFGSLVSPALWARVVSKVTTVESKLKSPWKPT